MNYQGLRFNTDANAVHLGGNVLEGDPFSYAPAVWNYVIGRFAIGSVLDLGCGLGHAAEYFFRKGLKVVAVDGLSDNVRNRLYPTVMLDITRGPVCCRVDLVHCQEVVEHIEELYLENLLVSLSAGQFILMTHAPPGQGGHHHVNLQPSEYWIAHLKRHGFSLLVEDTQRIRRLAAAEGAAYFSQAGLLFARGTG
jgi:SAM-dependent methyltransferase